MISIEKKFDILKQLLTTDDSWDYICLKQQISRGSLSNLKKWAEKENIRGYKFILNDYRDEFIEKYGKKKTVQVQKSKKVQNVFDKIVPGKGQKKLDDWTIKPKNHVLWTILDMIGSTTYKPSISEAKEEIKRWLDA